VYPSDVSQVLASVLAARAEGYNIREAVVVTGNGKEKNIKLGRDEDIAKRIELPLASARLVAASIR